MGVVMVSTTMSLDGFIAGPNHEMDWVFDHGFVPEGTVDVIDEMIASTGAILSGRGSYDVGRRSTREETSSAFGGRWSGPEFVLTHRPPSDPVRPSLTFLSGDIRDAVATALSAAAGRNLLVLGANVAQQCLEADLVDEVSLFLLPIVLGDGIRLFGTPGYRQMLFDPVRVEQVGKAVLWDLRRRR